MNKHDMVMKSNIKKKTEWTVFLDTVTIIAEKTAIIEKI
jgi:hypothetical protein